MPPEEKAEKTYTVSVVLVFIVLCAAAAMSRLMPLGMSPYPFNNDSLIECGIADEIATSHHLTFSADAPWEGTHSVNTPSFNLLIAFSSLLVGAESFECAQFLVAVFAVISVGGVYLLARTISGDSRAGLYASLGAVMFGTFVFTTGSVWKVSLGISLMILVYLAYTKRQRFEFRALMFVLLLAIPLVHHLVAAVAYISFGFLLAWSLFVAFEKKTFRERHMSDLVTIAPPIAAAVVYYSLALADRRAIFSTEIMMAVFMACFALVGLIAFFVLSVTKHFRLTFAPAVGIGLFIVLLLDYLGYVFPYTPSTTDAYVLLLVAISGIVTLAWYGSEIVIEKKPVYRAIHLALLVSPLTLFLYSLAGGFSSTSHQIVYRTFDLLDVFIFVGFGTALASFVTRRNRISSVVTVGAIILLASTFPFGYSSAELLGIRHDTQRYEIEAFDWISSSAGQVSVASDERLSFIANATIWVEKRAYLPYNLVNDISLVPGEFYVMEDEWASEGVNNYPYGLAVIGASEFVETLGKSNVVYVGGPIQNRLHVFFQG